ncbi:MAG TPA: isoaspartyl peptidase/L-asparaginase [Actinomycetota bacterium]|nr:isoaspartyl peptidase/L-asparaginase [Actinomycetota bacterium]
MSLVFVHGGVAGVQKAALAPLAPAVAAGAAMANAIEAVETAVRALEDEPTLNAGYGSVLDREGNLDLDAGLADGYSESWAGVAAVALAHPISFARLVLEKTPHVLLAGGGAQDFAEAQGLERLERSTPEQHERWAKAHKGGDFDRGLFARPEHVDTVGALALDDHGHVVAGSSTGGVFGKLPGRVGDAPIFGAGIYADRSVGVLGTGVGELFLETFACLRVARLVERGSGVQEACEQTIDVIVTRGLAGAPGRPGGTHAAGLLALDNEGNVGAAFSGATWQVEGVDGPLTPVQLQR